MRASWIAVGALLGGMALGATSAQADDNGIAAVLHSFRQIGGKTCFDDHYHDGSGSAATQRGAIADAIKNWSGFTSFEYGSDWGSFGNAVSKSTTCDRVSASFTCQVSAIPCKVSGRRR